MNTKNLSFKALALSLLMLSTGAMTFGAQDTTPTPEEVAKSSPHEPTEEERKQELAKLVAAYQAALKKFPTGELPEESKKKPSERYEESKERSKKLAELFAIREQVRAMIDSECKRMGYPGSVSITELSIETLNRNGLNVMPLCKSNKPAEKPNDHKEELSHGCIILGAEKPGQDTFFSMKIITKETRKKILRELNRKELKRTVCDTCKKKV